MNRSALFCLPCVLNNASSHNSDDHFHFFMKMVRTDLIQKLRATAELKQPLYSSHRQMCM